MTTRKKSKQKPLKSKRTAGKTTLAKKPAKKRRNTSKPARKKLAPKKVASKRRAAAKKPSATKSVSKKQTRARSPRGDAAFSEPGGGARSGEQSGDLQGLSRRESVDSESVDELLEEGNAFEAGVATGVEEADDLGEREVHTHEVPEDDVPEEYLDKD